MSRCKYCIHNTICDSIGMISPTGDCGYFKDRSRFVELPCKISGDCYFINTNGDVQRGTLDHIFMCSTFRDLVINDGREYYNISINDFNKIIFSSREEAEQALKEREEK